MFEKWVGEEFGDEGDRFAKCIDNIARAYKRALVTLSHLFLEGTNRAMLNVLRRDLHLVPMPPLYDKHLLLFYGRSLWMEQV